MADKKLTFLKYRVKTSHFLYESEKAVLVGIENKKGFWLDKKYIFKNDYTPKANISLVKEWEYRVVEVNDNDKYELVKVDKLLDIFNRLERNFFEKPKNKL